MYIEDDEFREIYQTVTPERLQTLEASLLDLEKNPQNTSRLEEFLREAHTLKGDSRMLGVTEVETLIHQIEDSMIEVKQGKVALTSQMCDRLHKGLDAINLLVEEAITGNPSGVNTFLVLAELMGGEDSSVDEQTNETVNENEEDLFEEEELFVEDEDLEAKDFLQEEEFFAENENLEAAELEEELFVGNEDLEAEVLQELEELEHKNDQALTKLERRRDDIGTIRVKTEELDNLVRQAGELSIAGLRINRRTGDISEIASLWEDWSQNFLFNKNIVKKLLSESDDEKFLKVQNFYLNAEQQLENLGKLINNLQNSAHEDNTRLSLISNELESEVKTLRLLPLSTVFNPLQRLVRDLSREQGKQIDLLIEGGETKADKRIIDEMKDPLLHIVRNAIDHGIETAQEREEKGKPAAATILLKGYQTSSNVGIEVKDDGRGLDVEKIKETALKRNIRTQEELNNMSEDEIQSLIFASGFSTRSQVNEISGRGVGLDVVRTNVEKLKGRLRVKSTPNQGCHFYLELNTSLGTIPALLLEVNQTVYALPMDIVQTMQLISAKEIFNAEGSQNIKFQDKPISVVWLADILNLQINSPSSTKAINQNEKNITCIVMRSHNDLLGILVDNIIDQQDIILKPQSKLLKRISNIFGATILGNGEVCMVLNAQDLFKSVKGKNTSSISKTTQTEKIKTQPKLLLVEDSIIIRTQMKRILEGAGYDLTIAVDGLEGFKKLEAGEFDVVVSDIEMPKMTGLELTAKIRQYPKYSELPIILVTTLAKEEDKRKGVAAGANAYLTKGDFDQKFLLNTLKRLL